MAIVDREFSITSDSNILPVSIVLILPEIVWITPSSAVRLKINTKTIFNMHKYYGIIKKFPLKTFTKTTFNMHIISYAFKYCICVYLLVVFNAHVH